MRNFKELVEKEVTEDILDYWFKTIDIENGGFYGLVTNGNTIIKDSPKGLVLNARILWTYSIAYRIFKSPKYLEMADHAYSFLVNSFYDKDYKGFYWILDYKGQVVNDKKQIYGIAFAIYGLSEYYRVTQKKEAIDLAIETFEMIEKYAFDSEKSGYLEALARDWSQTTEMQLLPNDVPSVKTMNTHLHLLEAYTNLYRTYKFVDLSKKLSYYK